MLSRKFLIKERDDSELNQFLNLISARLIMENFDNIQPAKFMIRIFKMFGIWYYTGPGELPYRIYMVILQSIFSYSFVFAMCINLVFIENLGNLTESFYMTLTELSMLLKMINLMTKSKQIVTLLNKMNCVIVQPRTSEELQLLKKIYKRFNNRRTIYTVLCLTCIISGYVGAFYARKLPFPAWFPFDWKTSTKRYLIVYVYEVVAMTINCLTNASFDLFQAYLMFQIAAFYHLMRLRVQTIGHYASIRVKDECVAISKLLECIRMHQFVNGMVLDAQDFLTVPMFVQINISGIVLCFTAFQMTLISPSQDPGTFFLYFFFMLSMLMEILLPCFHGSELIEQSDLVLTAVYNSNWTVLPIKYRKLTFYFMESLKKTSIIKAGGFFVIGLRTLGSVMQNAYSLFALILNLVK